MIREPYDVRASTHPIQVVVIVSSLGLEADVIGTTNPGTIGEMRTIHPNL